ncbi:GmrSD restriction endonuclease domain-containing protein [Plantibacter sp. Mn2098]|uniref:GmrSD restriction endonuclease domain-containing protein n=1 Tax=Plantibacter sp. Mn2098 TaxID=3395266 RepID=UPI003BE855F2
MSAPVSAPVSGPAPSWRRWLARRASPAAAPPAVPAPPTAPAPPAPPTASAEPSLNDRLLTIVRSFRPATWLGIVLTLILLSMSLVGGLGGLFMMASLVAAVTGIFTLATRRPGWLGIPSRGIALGVVGGALVVLVLGVSITSATAGPSASSAARPFLSGSSATPTTTATPTRTPSPTPTPTPTGDPLDPEVAQSAGITASVVAADTAATSGPALAVLDTLTVKGKAPKTGYERTAKFGKAWLDVDGNGCDTRNDVLARDLGDAQKAGACKVTAGTLQNPYTGTSLSFVRGNDTSALVQIDHVVSLSNAWQTGAQQLTQAQRITLANDPLNLIAVDAASNTQKGAGDAATWLPKNSGFRCDFAARQISVKATYGLWVTQPEKTALAGILAGCPDQQAVSSQFTPPKPEPVVVPEPAPAPEPEPAPAPDPEPAPAPPAAPDEVSGGGATALCNDGTLSYSAHRRGTCSHHGGVAIWY